MEFDTDTWMIERRKHAYIGESIGKPQYFKIWDDIAAHYEESRSRPIRIDIVNKMIERGVVKPGIDVMDVGCGPGTYSELFAEKCKNVFCVDSSQNMLDCLAKKNLSNVSFVKTEWETYESDEKYDLVFSSLCPAVKDPETVLKMESFSKRFCADVSFVIDGSISLRNKVWMAIGREPHASYWYDIRFPYELLKRSGRKPTLDIFERKDPFDIEKEKVIKSELENLSYYMEIDKDIREKVEKTVEENSVNGMVHFEGKSRLGLICWEIP